MKTFLNFLNESLGELENIGKALEFPNDNGKRSTPSILDWRKKGGYSGEKTIRKVLGNAEKLGWEKKSNTSNTHVAYDTVNNDIVFVDSTEKYCLSGNIYFGNNADDNRYSLTLTFNDTKKHSKVE